MSAARRTPRPKSARANRNREVELTPEMRALLKRLGIEDPLGNFSEQTGAQFD